LAARHKKSLSPYRIGIENPVLSSNGGTAPAFRSLPAKNNVEKAKKEKLHNPGTGPQIAQIPPKR
jgi:hypothetical protein